MLPKSTAEEKQKIPIATARETHVKSPRIRAIDIGRGIAMSLVILVHSTWSLARDTAGNLAYSNLPIVWLSQLATPAFLLISGMMLGYLYHSSNPEKFKRIKQKLAKRALILLTAIHLIINSSWAIHSADPILVLTIFGITDVIGLTLIAYLYLIPRVRIPFYPAPIFFIASWLLARIWVPDYYWAMVLKQILVGPSAGQPLIVHSSFALIPLACIYHTGVILGKKLSNAVINDTEGTFTKFLFRSGGLLIISAIFLHQVGKMALPMLGLHGADWEGAFYLFEKYPPSISYILFYCGAAMLLIASLLWYGNHFGGYGRWGAMFQVFGRTSLFTFAIQMHITLTIPFLLGINASLDRLEWLALFMVSLGLIWILSYLWLKYYMKFPAGIHSQHN